MGRFTRSAATSVFTTVLDFATLVGCVELIGLDYRLATFLGTVVGCTSNFLINRVWSFEATHGDLRWQIVRFLPVQAGSSTLQTLGVWLFTEYVDLPYLGSKTIVAVAVYLGWNYPLNRYFVFRRRASRGTSGGTSPLAA
jgi:putative flippase GtrA